MRLCQNENFGTVLFLWGVEFYGLIIDIECFLVWIGLFRENYLKRGGECIMK